MEDVSIFPFIEVTEFEMEEIKEESETVIAKEYAWDFDEWDFKYKNGKMYLVEGKEALKIWLWKLFRTNRFQYIIFSWGYGSELEELIGQGYTQGYLNSEAERYVREAIEYNLNDYIIEIREVEVDFIDGVLVINATAITIYGEVDFIA